MKRALLLVASALLAIGGTTAIGIIDTSSEVCAAGAKVSFADDVLPIFKGYCFSCINPAGRAIKKAGWT